MKIRTRTKAGQDIPAKELADKLAEYAGNSWGVGKAGYPYRQCGGPIRDI